MTMTIELLTKTELEIGDTEKDGGGTDDKGQ